MPMLRTRRSRRIRRGFVEIIEAALVVPLFLMLLFGMFEYCRFLMVLHLTGNAARDGTRYAAVNLSKPASFTTTNYTDASGNVYPSITSYTTSLMGSMQKNLSGFTITVNAYDQNGNLLTGTTWNSVTFPQQVGVTVSGTYQPITPLLLFMPSSIPVSSTVVMVAEG